MILYTPMQLELVFEGLEEMKHPAAREIDIDGSRVMVEDIGQGKGRVIRLISTNPRDFLKSELAPGSILNINCADF